MQRVVARRAAGILTRVVVAAKMADDVQMSAAANAHADAATVGFSALDADYPGW
jgi:hypothetical protein